MKHQHMSSWMTRLPYNLNSRVTEGRNKKCREGATYPDSSYIEKNDNAESNLCYIY